MHVLESHSFSPDVSAWALWQHCMMIMVIRAKSQL